VTDKSVTIDKKMVVKPQKLNKIRTQSSDHDLVMHRRESIGLHAIKLFAKKGYKYTNVDEIAAACGMSKGNIYNYVGTKEDILALALDLIYAPTKELCDGIAAIPHNIKATEALKRAIKLLFQWADKTKDMIQFIYHETRILHPAARKVAFELDEKIMKQIEEILTRGCKSGEFYIEDITMVAHETLVLAEMWAVRRWFLAKRYTLDELIDKRIDLIFRSIKRS
jgi:AcrR family transcriptional regulator